LRIHLVSPASKSRAAGKGKRITLPLRPFPATCSR
jgi:hypothetical protein